MNIAFWNTNLQQTSPFHSPGLKYFLMALKKDFFNSFLLDVKVDLMDDFDPEIGDKGTPIIFSYLSNSV